MCEYNGKMEECIPSDITALKQSVSNTLKQVEQISIQVVGTRYGFVIPSTKTNTYIFKVAEFDKNNPKKLQKGSECAGNSQTGQHKIKIQELGEILDKVLDEDFDLTIDKISTGDDKLENAVRICYLMSLVLRWMDKMKINNKRWMYRAVSANLAGYNNESDKKEKKGKK